MSQVNMVINPQVIKNFEEDMVRNAKHDQKIISDCDHMDALLRKLGEQYHSGMTLGELAVNVHEKRQQATQRLANILTEAPVKRRKKRKYTRRKANATVKRATKRTTNALRTKKKSVKKRATKK